MATVFREPLGFGPQQKRPIPAVDSFSRALTLGINPNASFLQLDQSAPAARRAVNSDRYPNLLLTTLSGALAVLSLPLSSGRVFDSAPRKAWQADALTAQGFLVCPDAPIQGLDASAPQAPRFLRHLQPPNLLTTTLGVVPSAPAGRPLFESAPRASQVLSIDLSQDLLGTTLVVTVAVPGFAIRLDASAPSTKYQFRTESLSRPLTLGINPNAAALSIIDSATPRKVEAYSFDPPNILGTTLTVPLALPLSAMRMDWSATPRKFVAYPFDPLNLQLYIPVTVVPDVVGQSQASGSTQLMGSSFLVSVLTAYSATVAAGIIISQDPAAGSQAGTGSTVTITVSLGAAPVSDFSGGIEYAFAREQELRRKERDRLVQAKADAAQIEDETTRGIAKLLRAQESQDLRRGELARLSKLAQHYSNQAEVTNERIKQATEKAATRQTDASLYALERELMRAQEEQEFLMHALSIILDA